METMVFRSIIERNKMFKKLALSLMLVVSVSAPACPPTALSIAAWVISSAAAYAAPVAKAAVIAAIKVVVPMPTTK